MNMDFKGTVEVTKIVEYSTLMLIIFNFYSIFWNSYSRCDILRFIKYMCYIWD